MFRKIKFIIIVLGGIEMTQKGHLIVMEGSGDGCGKSTQFALLEQELQKDGKDIFTHHFPSYGTYYGASVEHYLTGEYGTDPKLLSPYFINSLYAMDRAVACHLFLKDAYESGKTILLDRYTTSSLIYQSVNIDDLEEKKAFLDYIIDYEYQKLEIYPPDHVIFLHLPFEIIKRLREARHHNDGIANDIHERDIEFSKKIYENSTFLADYFDWDVIECSHNGTIRSREEIHKDVYRLVKARDK